MNHPVISSAYRADPSARIARTMSDAFGPYAGLHTPPSKWHVLLDVLKARPDLPVAVGLVFAATVVVILVATGLSGVPA